MVVVIVKLPENYIFSCLFVWVNHRVVVVVVVVVGKMGEVAGVKRMEKLLLNPAQNSLLINNCGAQGNLQLLVCRQFFFSQLYLSPQLILSFDAQVQNLFISFSSDRSSLHYEYAANFLRFSLSSHHSITTVVLSSLQNHQCKSGQVMCVKWLKQQNPIYRGSFKIYFHCLFSLHASSMGDPWRGQEGGQVALSHWKLSQHLSYSRPPAPSNIQPPRIIKNHSHLFWPPLHFPCIGVSCTMGIKIPLNHPPTLPPTLETPVTESREGVKKLYILQSD